MPAITEGKLHGFQLWVNMPAKLKMSKPDYIYIDSNKMQIHKNMHKKYHYIFLHNQEKNLIELIYI